MIRTRTDEAGKMRLLLTLACVTPLLMFGMTACATTGDRVDEANGSGSGTTSAPSEDDPEPANSGSPDSPSSQTLLEMGMVGDTAVKCDYEAGKVVGTIYFDGPDRQRFDGVSGEGAPGHIVLHAGQAHAWNDSQSKGLRYPKSGASYLVDEDPEVVKAHSSNCVPHHDPSVFELPADVDFVDLPTEQDDRTSGVDAPVVAASKKTEERILDRLVVELARLPGDPAASR